MGRLGLAHRESLEAETGFEKCQTSFQARGLRIMNYAALRW